MAQKSGEIFGICLSLQHQHTQTKKYTRKKIICIERSDTELSGCIKIISVRNQKTVNIDKNLSAN